MSAIQTVLYAIEVGKGRVLMGIVPVLIAFVAILVIYDFTIYRGLNDAQSMDNAQLARQIALGKGYTTLFLRPFALAQLHDYNMSQGKGADLFPAAQFPPATPRLLPDTYNAPGYPVLLAAWFKITRPSLDQPGNLSASQPLFPAERWIPILNQIFVFLTALLIFGLSFRLFDQRVAWMAAISFLVTDMVWQYSITALSTTFLMFLITGIFFVALEIFCIGEESFERSEDALGWAWGWGLLLSALLAIACLTRLHFLVLLVPLMALLFLMPKANPLLPILTAILVMAAVAPWFWHMYSISGNPIGSNLPFLLYGDDDYKGNQIFCSVSIPSYERLFKDAGRKEFLGFGWHLQHAWELLGSNPLILVFAVATLHSFRQDRAQAFRWLIIGSAVCIITVNNLGVAQPTPVSPWNSLATLFPCMLVIGSAYFFILLDRLNLQAIIITTLIMVITTVLTFIPLGVSFTAPYTYKAIINYPPYVPNDLNYLAKLAQPDEWVTSDMPWATAWYGNRASLWLPDSLTTFETFHDNFCPTGVLIFTPVTSDAPASNLTLGEYKDWFTLAMGFEPPKTFPLQAHTTPAGHIPDYNIWSNRVRWQ